MKQLIITMFIMINIINLSAEDSEQLDKDILKAIDHIKAAIEAPYKNKSKYDHSKLEIQYMKYEKACTELGHLVSKSQINRIRSKKEIRLEEAIMTIAYDFVNKPELVKNILDYYKLSLPPRESLPRLLREHYKSDYLSAWQYILLAPPIRQIASINKRGGGYPLNALFMINDIHSSPVLNYIFIVKFSSIMFNSYVDSRLVRMTARFPSLQSLNYLLTALNACEKSNWRFSTNLIQQKLIVTMSGKNNSWSQIKVDKKKWRDVILAYPKGELLQWQKEFLDDVLKAIDEQEKKETKATE